MKTYLNKTRSARRQHGATLIEVMVAVLVLSIGMLGIAGLTSASMRYSQGSWARATVSAALTDFADRVRSNPAASATAYLQSSDNYSTQQGGSYALSYSTDCSSASANCSGSDLAAYQLEQWRLSVKRSLPSSAIWVSGSRSTGYEATVLWFDKGFVQSDGVTLDTATTCATTITNAIAQRSCCPSGAVGGTGVPGVRCTNMTVVP
ncbi:type IV pilus modification protein PilV [Piscinibacter terrae]|nr:type IV pilus modification protein PilV [Albitalea terrae]